MYDVAFKNPFYTTSGFLDKTLYKIGQLSMTKFIVTVQSDLYMCNMI